MNNTTQRIVYFLIAIFISTGRIYSQCPISVNATPVTSTICSGSSVNLSATSSAAGTTFSWSPSTGLSSSSIANPVASPTTTTTYTVTGMLANGSNVITNGNFESGNVGFSSQYNGNPTAGTWGLLSNPGTYAVTSSANNVHNNFAAFNDHTPNPGTNYMVVNGSVGSGTKVWCQTFAVVPGTTYVFSCWVTNVENMTDPAQLATLNFDINGVNIGNNFTPTLGMPNWTQYSTNWTAPAGTSSVTLCIENTNLQEAGNDFGLDDISFQTACTSTSSVTVNVINPSASNNGPVCSGQSINLNAATYTGATYSWSGPSGFSAITQSATASPSASGTYTVNVTANGVTCPATTSVIVNPNPTSSIAPISPVCLGQSVNLSGTVSGPINTTVTATNSTATTLIMGGISSGWTGTGGSYITSNIPVSGLNTNWTLTSVVLNISHIWDSDLIAYLYNPCGNSIALISSNGGSGDNFTNTTFTPGATTAISAGTPPFNGTFIPAGGAAAWSAFITASQGCASANGTWSLRVGDMYSDNGTLNSWTLNFSNPNNTTYAWSPTTNMTNSTTLTPTVTPVVAGTTTYTLTATNTYGCVASSTIDVVAGSNATANANVDQSVCSGGTINLAGSIGGSGSIGTWTAPSGTFSNSTSLTSTYTPSITSGSVTLTLTTDDPPGSCIGASDQMVVTISPAASPNAGPDQSICFGESVTIGNDPVWTEEGATYSWNNSAGSGTIDLSGAGQNHGTAIVSPTTTATYTLTVTTLANCVSTDAVTVTVGSSPTANANIDQTVCVGGTINLSGSFGGSAINASWSAPSGTFSNPSSLTSTYTPTITSGSVVLTLTTNDPVGSCTSASDQMTVTISPLPTVTVNSASICSGSSTIITATPGIAGTYNYVWTVPAGAVNPGNVPSFSASIAGTYSVIITNISTQCSSSSASGTLSYISPPTVSVNNPSVCSGFSASVIATPGNAGTYNYAWTVPAGATDPGNVSNFNSSIAGTYSVVITSTVSGCSSLSASGTLTINLPPTVVVDDQSVCTGGTITLNASGANTYSWSPGTYLNSSIGSSVNFTAGNTTTYTITGTSSAGCIGTDLATVTVQSSAPINAGPDVAICSGSSTNLNALGGNTYSWDNGLGVGNNFSVSPTSTTTYIVTGTDIAGCVGTDALTVTVNSSPVVNGGSDQIICANTSIILSASGAQSYTWNNSVVNGVSFIPSATTIYTVTGTSIDGCIDTDDVSVTVNPIPTVNAGADQNVCSGGQITLTGSGAGTYSWTGGVSNGVAFIPSSTMTYTVTGTSLGCTSTDDVNVTVNPIPIVDAGADQVFCQGTSTALTASGATSYSWNNGITNGLSFIPSVGSVTYTVTGTSAANCTASDQVTVTVNPNPSPVINGSLQYCTGNFAVLGTAGSYNLYSWSTGSGSATTNATQVDNPITVTVTNNFGCQGTSAPVSVTENGLITTNPTISICQGESAVIHGVSQTNAGTYSQTFQTVSGCDSVANVTLIVNPLPTVNAGADISECDGASVTLNGSGANSYSWSNGITNGSAFIPSVGTTTYTVTGTTDQGCTGTDQIDVTINPLPIIDAGSDQSICAGSSVSLTGSGAAIYSWNNGVVDGVTFQPLSTQTYTLTGTSAAGCIGNDLVIVTVNPIPTINAGNDLNICEGGSVTLTASGASSYTWDNGIINGVPFNPTGSITYTVTGTTAGCAASDQVIVTVNPLPFVSFTPDITSGCSPLDVTFTNTTVGSSNCFWTFSDGTTMNGCGQVSNTFENPGCYDVSLTTTDVNGCSNSATLSDLICVEGAPDASFVPSTSSISDFNSEVDFNNTSTGASSYSWDFGDGSQLSTETDPSHFYEVDHSGNISVTLIASSPLGCLDTAYSIIVIKEELLFFVPNTFTPDGDIFNQTFQPVFTSGFDPFDYSLLIFDRWGEIIFESHNAEIGWDGSYGATQNLGIVQDGSYTWKIEFKTSSSDERKVVMGHVSVIR